MIWGDKLSFFSFLFLLCTIFNSEFTAWMKSSDPIGHNLSPLLDQPHQRIPGGFSSYTNQKATSTEAAAKAFLGTGKTLLKVKKKKNTTTGGFSHQRDRHCGASQLTTCLSLSDAPQTKRKYCEDANSFKWQQKQNQTGTLWMWQPHLFHSLLVYGFAQTRRKKLKKKEDKCKC